MKNRLRFFRQTFMLLATMMCASNLLFSQFSFDPQNQMITADPGTCSAILDFTPSLPGPAGPLFPSLINEGTSTAVSMTIIGSIVFDGTATGASTDPIRTLTVNPGAGDATITVTVRIVDNMGMEFDVPFSIEAGDGTAPVLSATPADATVDCVADIPAIVAPITATDNCDGALGTITPVISATPDQCAGGTLTRTWTATDAAGNSVVYTQSIVVNADTDAPNPNGGSLPPAGPVCALGDYPEATTIAAFEAILSSGDISDGCSSDADLTITSTTTQIGLGTCPTTYTREYVIGDACGNTINLSQTITVDDTSAPTFTTTPQDAVADCMSGTGNAGSQFADWIATGGNAVINDNCSGFITITAAVGGTDITADPASALNMPCPDGTYTVDFTFTDECNGAITGSATYTISDTNPPEIDTGARDITVGCANFVNDLNGWLFVLGDAEASDICSNGTTLADTTLVVDGTAYDYVTGFAAARAAVEAEIAAQASTCTGTEIARVQVMFTFEDLCGNVSTTDADFVVEDADAPVWDDTPDDLTLECDGAGNAADITAWLAANEGGAAFMGVSGAASDCGTITYTNDYAGLSDLCGATGTATVTFTATDPCGNAETAMATITIQDTTNPTFTVPADITIDCTASTAPANTGDVTDEADGCDTGVADGGAREAVSSDVVAAGTPACPANMVITRTWTLTDDCGNSNVQTQTITITDTTAPDWSGNTPDDLTVECDGSGNTADLTAWLAANSGGATGAATDDCSTITYSDNFTSLSDLCGATGSTFVIFTATDACGNAASETATFTIDDTTDPTLDTPASNMTVECDGAGNAADLNAWLASNGGAAASDACGGVTWSNDFTALSDLCGATGAATVIFTATDDCGNTVTTSATFTIQDTTVPDVSSCPSLDNTEECTGGGFVSGTTGQSWHDNNMSILMACASDACGTVTVTSDFPGTFTPGTCGGTGTLVVNYTLTDDCGLVSNLSGSLVIEDNISPTIMPTSNSITEECGGGDDQTVLNAWIDAMGNSMAADACSEPLDESIVWTDADGMTGMGAVPGTYPTIAANDCDWFVDVTFTYTDQCGNPSTTTSRFSIEDTTAPALAGVPADVTAECDAVPAPATPTATDDCDAMVDIVLVADTTAGVCPQAYTISRTWTATDDCGNTDIGVQVVTVEDTTAPTFTQPADVTIECDQNPDDLTITGDVTVVMDNCDMMPDTSYSDVVTPSLACPQESTITRTWTVTDACGNATSLIQTITVEDSTNPMLVDVPADTLVNCDAIPIAPSLTATDNCDNIVTVALNSVSTKGTDPDMCDFYDYTITRTWTATDDCGNSDVGVQVVTVQDTIRPVLSAMPADVTVECGDALITTPPTITASDNCDADPDLAFMEVSTAGACPSGYTVTRTWTAMDACGNDTMHVQVITVNDTQGPIFSNCLEDVTINTSDDGTGDCDVAYTFNAPIATDACSVDMSPCTATDIVAITGAADPNTIVDDVVLNFAVAGPATTAVGNVTLTIDFDQLDGEFGTVASTEYFFIQGEDGSALGQTIPATSQCSAPATTTISIPEADFNIWALDGTVTITLVPNDPGPGNGDEGINNICGGSNATGNLSYNCQTPPAGFTVTYNVDGGAEMPVTYPTISETFTGGTSVVTFTATDCAGNSSTCSFNVVINDDEDPSIGNCTLVNTAILAPDCTPQDVMLPRPSDIMDNCEVDSFTMMLTSGVHFPIVTFTEHPNIDGFVMDTAKMSFTSVIPPYPTGDATIEIYFQGDGDDLGASEEFFEVFGEDGMSLGVTTTATSVSCGTTPERVGTITVPYADLIMWIADGSIDLQVVPVIDNLSGFGNDGDWNNDDFGINPCVAPGTFAGTEINVNDGGNSVLQVRMSFPNPVISYCVEGATTIASTAFPADGSDPTVTLNPGANTIIYKVADAAGNIDSLCTAVYTVGDPTLPTPILSVTTSPSCPGDFVVIEDGQTYTGNPVWTWYLDNAPLGSNMGEDAIIGTTTSPSIFFQALPGNHDYYAIVTENVCTSAASASVTVVGGAAPAKPQIFASPNPVCSGDDFGLFLANSSPEWVSYVWTGSDGYGYNGQFPPSITGINNTSTTNNILTYILTVESFTGCTSSDTVLVEVRPLPETPSLNTNSPICNNDDIVLSTSATCDSYQWIGPNGASTGTLASYASTTTTPMTTVPFGSIGYAEGMWTVICISNNGCSAESAPSEVVISDPITAAPSNDGPACEGDDVQLSVADVPGAVSYVWSGPVAYSSMNQNPILSSISVFSAGVYTVTVTDANGCTGVGSTTVVVNTAPEVTAISVNPPDGTCVNGSDDILLEPTVTPADSGTYGYQWSGPGGFTSTSPTATIPNGTSADNGSYVLQVTNAAGCVSDAFTVVVDVRDEPTTPTVSLNDDELCVGDLLELTTNGYTGGTISYTWTTPSGTVTTATPSLTVSSVEVTDGGAYSVSVNVDGCDSNESASVSVTVTPVPMTPMVNGPTAVCEGDLIQLETDLIAGASYEWTGPAGFSASVHNPSVFPATAANAGAYSVRVLINGCPSAYSTALNVAVNPVPAAPTVENNGPICIDDTGAVLTLSVSSGTAIAGATYEWFDASTNNSLGSSGLSTSFNISDFGAYGEGVFDFYVVATLADCASGPSVPTSVIMNTIPSDIAFAGADQQVCDGLITNLNADAPSIGIGTWTQISGPAATIVTPNAPNSSITDLAGGNTYTFRWTLSNGACGDYSADDVSIVVSDGTQLAEAGGVVMICNGTTGNLAATAANAGNVGTWTQSATQSTLGVVIADPSDPNTAISGLVPGNTYEFTWTLSNSGCGDFASDIVQVMVEDNDLNAYAGEDIVECGNGDALISAESTASCTGLWSSPDPELVFADEISSTTVVMDLKVGENILVWTVDCGPCGVDSDTLVITYEDEPVAVPDVTTVAFNDTVSISVIGNDFLPENYSIRIIESPLSGSITQTGDGVWLYTHEGSDDTPDSFTYEVCSDACPDKCSSATVGINVEAEDCTIPTIITPNGDGINDEFVVECLFATGKYPNNSVIIFNQWGDEVFRAMPYNNDWGGTYNGEELPVGTYYYIVDFGDGSTEPQAGFLVLER